MGAREICRFAFSALLLVSVAVCGGCKFLGFSHNSKSKKRTIHLEKFGITVKDVNEWEDVGDPDLAKYCIPNWPKANPDRLETILNKIICI